MYIIVNVLYVCTYQSLYFFCTFKISSEIFSFRGKFLFFLSSLQLYHWTLDLYLKKFCLKCRNNTSMTLDEFKWIWYMEYGHRMWGRAVGAAFLFPAIYFWKKNWFASAMKKRVLIFGSLILCQVNFFFLMLLLQI